MQMIETEARMPTLRRVRAARRVFQRRERRALFYRAATELLALIRRGPSSVTVAEALAVLLQTWNSAAYQYDHAEREHLRRITRLLTAHAAVLNAFTERALETLGEGDIAAIVKLFNDFDLAVGPVGAAKCLHLLAPRFFPLWDRAIACAYRVRLKHRGENADRYIHFMQMCRTQVQRLGGERRMGQNVLKALDEYNYCVFTKRWM